MIISEVDMIKRLFLIMLCGVLLTGCVSNAKYKSLEKRVAVIEEKLNINPDSNDSGEESVDANSLVGTWVRTQLQEDSCLAIMENGDVYLFSVDHKRDYYSSDSTYLEPLNDSYIKRSEKGHIDEMGNIIFTGKYTGLHNQPDSKYYYNCQSVEYEPENRVLGKVSQTSQEVISVTDRNSWSYVRSDQYLEFVTNDFEPSPVYSEKRKAEMFDNQY